MAVLVQSCSSDESESINADGNRINSYGAAREYPSEVLKLMKHLEGVAPRSSIEEFEAGLEEIEVVEMPYGHFKD